MDENQLWKKNDDEHVNFEKGIREVHSAIFGDEDGNLGMKKQLEEMYSVFVPVTMTGKAIIKLIMILGSIAAAVTAVLELAGLIKHTK